MALKVTIAIAGGIIIAAGIFKRIWKDKITTDAYDLNRK